MLQNGSMRGWALALLHDWQVRIVQSIRSVDLPRVLASYQAFGDCVPPSMQRLLRKTGSQVLCRPKTRPHTLMP